MPMSTSSSLIFEKKEVDGRRSGQLTIQQNLLNCNSFRPSWWLRFGMNRCRKFEITPTCIRFFFLALCFGKEICCLNVFYILHVDS